MPRCDTSSRERAARALCRFHGVPESTLFEGVPMWQSYLDEVDVVLRAIGWDKDNAEPAERG